MSLATRCPACGTAFRVVQDQLRVSDGWVRCGQCQEVFNALEGLFDLRAPVPGAPDTAPPPSSTAPAPDEFVLTDGPQTPAHGDADGTAEGAAVEPTGDALAVSPEVGPDTGPEVGASVGPDAGPDAGPHGEPKVAPEGTTTLGAVAAPDAAPGPPPPEPGLDFDLDLSVDGQPRPAPAAGQAPVGESPPEAADAVAATAVEAPPGAALDAGPAAPADASVDADDTPIEPPIEPPPRRAVPPGLRLRDRARARAQARAQAADAGDEGPPPMAIALDDADADLPADAEAAADPALERKRRRRRKPGFVAEAERAARWQRPAVRAALGVAVLLLGAGALAQAGWLFRDELAARHPALAPALQAMCRSLGCTVQAPRALQRLSVEGATLNRLADGDAAAATHRLSVLVRNAADHRVAAPAIDLALSDATGRPIARRVLQGRELGDGVAADIGPGGEWSVQLALRVDDPRVAGFTVEIFYP